MQHVGRKECAISLRLPQPTARSQSPSGGYKVPRVDNLCWFDPVISEADDLPQRMPDSWKSSELICHLNKAEAQHHWDVMSLLLMFNVGLFHFWISSQCESTQTSRPCKNSFSYLHNCFFHLLDIDERDVELAVIFTKQLRRPGRWCRVKTKRYFINKVSKAIEHSNNKTLRK